MVQSDRNNSIGCQFIPHEIITVQQPRRELPDSIRAIMIADVGQETFEVFTADIFGMGTGCMTVKRTPMDAWWRTTLQLIAGSE